jgi:predicted RNase H-like HicB family nuclease
MMESSALLQSSTFSLTAILHWEEDVYVAECPEVGTASQGDTVEEALTNLPEATELYLEEFPLSENLLLRAIFAFPIT